MNWTFRGAAITAVVLCLAGVLRAVQIFDQREPAPPAPSEQYDTPHWEGIGWVGGTLSGVDERGGHWSSSGPGWSGLGWTGRGWNAIGWTGAGWQGLPWGGIASASDCGEGDACTTLHDWFSHVDVDGDGLTGTVDDSLRRLHELRTWVSCACVQGVTIPLLEAGGRHNSWWNGETATFRGELGLAPTWCSGDVSVAVPQIELERVSACMMARVNTRAQQVPLSLLIPESAQPQTRNELLTSDPARAAYFGNLWTLPHVALDSTTSQSADLAQTGGSWWNVERFSCALPGWTRDWTFAGRGCDGADCLGQIWHLGLCSSGQKRLGNLASHDPQQPDVQYYSAVRPDRADPVVAGGLSLTVNSTNGVPQFVNYRGRMWPTLAVATPKPIGLENPLNTFPAGVSAWAQVEAGTVDPVQSRGCAAGTVECHNGRKLMGLTSTQAISVNLTGNLPQRARAGDRAKPVTIAIRYAWPRLLGPGQCDPDGCGVTVSYQCASGNVSTSGTGCDRGSSDGGALRVWVNNNRVAASGWTAVHGTGSPYGKQMFVPTYSSSEYRTAYIYPVYVQDSFASIPGAIDHTPGTTYDTLRMWLSGETENPADAPELDVAYFFAGLPPGSADCAGANGCWLYAGPDTQVTLDLRQTWRHRTPALPAGRYTFTASEVQGDVDLYVNVNATATEKQYQCRGFNAGQTTETCTVVLDAEGYISVMLLGYGSGSNRARLIGRN